MNLKSRLNGQRAVGATLYAVVLAVPHAEVTVGAFGSHVTALLVRDLLADEQVPGVEATVRVQPIPYVA